jgi:hypothetical protein
MNRKPFWEDVSKVMETGFARLGIALYVGLAINLVPMALTPFAILMVIPNYFLNSLN